VLFFAAFTLIIGVKLDKLLDSLARTIKLEFYDPIGKVCIVGIILITFLFLICFMSSEVMALVTSFLKPELASHSINPTMGILIVVLSFAINLVVLSILEAYRKR
jgi:hypothetical protein